MINKIIWLVIFIILNIILLNNISNKTSYIPTFTDEINEVICIEEGI